MARLHPEAQRELPAVAADGDEIVARLRQLHAVDGEMPRIGSARLPLGDDIAPRIEQGEGGLQSAPPRRPHVGSDHISLCAVKQVCERSSAHGAVEERLRANPTGGGEVAGLSRFRRGGAGGEDEQSKAGHARVQSTARARGNAP
jgi:hypothetical protein